MQRICVLLAFAVLLSACAKEQQEQTLRGKTMGTTWMVKYVGSPSIQAKVIQDYLDGFNQTMSTYIKDSEISKINRSPMQKWLPISTDLSEIIELSLTISKQTQGAFDITVGRAVNFWGFGAEKTNTQPKKREIGYQYIKINNKQLYKEKNIYLDLSAIAKGHAVDKVATLLESAQINRYLVEIGGEIISKGKNRKQQFWKVAIEQPDPVQRSILQTVELNNQAIASSGSYRNFKQQNGKIITHTIDPKTAKPIAHNVIASSVIADSAAVADAYATAFMVLPTTTSIKISDEKNFATLIVVGQMNDANTFVKHHSKRFNSIVK